LAKSRAAAAFRRIIQKMSKPLILIADDHTDVRQALSLLLRDCGYEVATAASPAEALSALRRSPPDLVLLDLNYQRDTTSGAEGLALLKQVRAQHRELPVVILTGWATVSLAVAAMQLGPRTSSRSPGRTRVCARFSHIIWPQPGPAPRCGASMTTAD
jgi:DNA-binding NtrC family response regulator